MATWDGTGTGPGVGLSCTCGTATCTVAKMGCNATADQCVCPPGSAWGDISGQTECIICGPYNLYGSQSYTAGYQCAGGSITVVGDGKTICPVGTVDYRECDMPNTYTCKKGTASCRACSAGQYQDEEGQEKIIGLGEMGKVWYVFFFFPPPSSFPFSLSLAPKSHTLSQFNLIYFFNY